MRKVAISACFCFLLILGLAGGLRAAEVKEVVVTGSGVSKNAAIREALRTAIEQALGVFIDSSTRVENSELIEDKILSHAEGYVSGQEVIEEKSGKDSFWVKVKVKVSLEPLKDELARLKILIKTIGDPRIMVIIPETHIAHPRVPDPAGETEIIRKLIDAGYKIVDPHIVSSIRYGDLVNKLLRGDTTAAQQIGSKYGADIIIIGEAFSEENPNPTLRDTGLSSARARVEARAVWASNGEVIAAHGIHASGVDYTLVAAGKKALAQAGSEMADYFIPLLVGKKGGEKTLKLMFTNVTSLSKLKSLMNYIQSISGVGGVFQREFSSAAGLALLDVDVNLSAQDFASELEKSKDLRIAIKNVDMSRIDAELK